MIITISTQKGGTGKTTTAQGLAFGLRSKGYRVLLIDLDEQQAGLSSIMGCKPSHTTAYEMLKGECSAADAIQHTDLGDIIPRSSRLGNIEADLRGAGRELRLKRALDGLKGYDFIIIDTPPASGVLIDNALTVSDYVIIPTQADVMAFYALEQGLKTINTVKDYTNPNLKILGILITRYNARTSLSQQVIKGLEARAESIGTSLFETHMRESVAIREDQAEGKNTMDRRNGNAVADLKNLTSEFLKKVGA